MSLFSKRHLQFRQTGKSDPFQNLDENNSDAITYMISTCSLTFFVNITKSLFIKHHDLSQCTYVEDFVINVFSKLIPFGMQYRLLSVVPLG